MLGDDDGGLKETFLGDGMRVWLDNRLGLMDFDFDDRKRDRRLRLAELAVGNLT